MDRKFINKLLPEIRFIKNKKIREAAADAWLLAIKKGKWKKIDDIPFTLLIKTTKTLIEHTRCVTRMARAIVREQKAVNHDFVIAGALVHDVGKLLEYKKHAGKFVKSDYGKRIRHPVSGYALALDVGLPLEVAHIVAAHSAEGDKVLRSKEAIIINHCDFIDFDIAKSEQ